MAVKKKSRGVFDLIGDVIMAPARFAGDLSNEYFYGGTDELNRRRQFNRDLRTRKMELAEDQFKFLKKTARRGNKMAQVKQLWEIANHPRPPQYGGPSIEERQAAKDEAMRIILKRQGGTGQITGGWQGTPQAQPQAGGAFGNLFGGVAPEGMITEKIETGQGYPVHTYGQEFAKPKGAYKYIPKGDLEALARQDIAKPSTSVTLNTGNAQVSAKQDAEIAATYQQKVDELNANNPRSPSRYIVKTSTANGRRYIGTERKSAGELDTINKLENVKRRALRAKQLWKKEYTGWVQGGLLGKTKEITGLMQGEESRFRQNIKSLVKQMYADSGKQLSDKEWDRLQETMPRLDTADNVFKPQLDEWINNINADLRQLRGEQESEVTTSLSQEEIDIQSRLDEINRLLEGTEAPEGTEPVAPSITPETESEVAELEPIERPKKEEKKYLVDSYPAPTGKHSFLTTLINAPNEREARRWYELHAKKVGEERPFEELWRKKR